MAFVRNCLMRAMEYRAQFWTNAIVYLIWSGSSLLFINVVFKRVGIVRDWKTEEMYVLYGTYVILESLCYGVLGPNMWRFNSYIREGTLDLVLTKPVNAQFLSSTRYIDVNGIGNMVVGVALIVYGLVELQFVPSVLFMALWITALGCGLLIAYSIWFMIVTLTIWTVKLQAAGAAFDPILQMAKFPVSIYPQRLQMLFTFVLPVAFLTTVPTMFLLGRGKVESLGFAFVASVVFLALSSRFWNFALKYYGSASS
jgi:ABC-2 type transport system permease protein